ncbi:MAG: benzylsuccinate CoA-transferase BbsF subunit [Chloroflexi bacterium]|jgi:benzylsuccinate CoA-transferase BbsF subunit|nr:MAG: benzylsuccinate CoA-transferase BbsF subunit [Chloroflexota bacterium]
MTGIFEGINVLDFCWVAVGPMTTRYFSDFGATVVRVESQNRPDVIRSGLPFADGRAGVNRSGYWVNYNGGKLGLTLNMAHPDARQVAFELATGWADVVAENFTPGTLEKWGLGYEEVAKANPGVVMFSASMMGRGGPYASQPGFGPVLTAISGHTHFTGWPDRIPVSPYGAYTDFVIPHLAVAAIIGALDQRRETGQGQHLDLSQLEASLQFLAPAILDYTVNGRVGGRDGNRDPAMAPHGAYPCAGNERWCAIACATDEQWASLAALMGQADLIGDQRFASLRARKSNEDALDQIVGAWTVRRKAQEVMALCQNEGIPAGVVETCEDLFADPQLRERDHFAIIAHPEMGNYSTEANCFRLSETRPDYRRAPLLGEHTEYVLRQLLGMSQERFDALAGDRALD